MDHSTSSGDEGRASSRHREGNNDGKQGNRHQYHNSRDYDTRSQSSYKSDPYSETSGGRGELSHYNLSASSSVGSYGSGGGDEHVHFRHATESATHLLNGDPVHRFPPSLYQSSADAPKSDTATVCSSSMLEDIEDVGSHYDGDSTQGSTSKQQQHHHNYPPPSSLRRSNSKEGNRLVDFAERSQAVFPRQSKSTAHAAGTSQQESSLPNAEEESSIGIATQHRQGMGPPLSRHWLLQHHGISPFRTGSVRSGGSTAGSDVVVNVGSDCGGSLTDVQSILSQEDAALLTLANSENSAEALASAASAAKADTLDTSTNSNSGSAGAAEDEKKPHPLLVDQSGSTKSGRISPGGTIYRGRGVRRYKGRFYALPLKRFHQDGVHLHSDSEPEGTHQSRNRQYQERQRHEDRDHHRYGGNDRDDYQRDGDNHDYHGDSSSRYRRDRNHDRGRDRSRSRSRSRSPPVDDRKREARNTAMDRNRGYKIDRK